MEQLLQFHTAGVIGLVGVYANSTAGKRIPRIDWIGLGCNAPAFNCARTVSEPIYPIRRNCILSESRFTSLLESSIVTEKRWNLWQPLRSLASRGSVRDESDLPKLKAQPASPPARRNVNGCALSASFNNKSVWSSMGSANGVATINRT